MASGMRVSLGKPMVAALALALAVLATPLAAQTPKPGLWEMTIASKVSGDTVPQGHGGRTMKMLVCIHPEDVKGGLEQLAQNMQAGDEDCAVSDFKMSGQTYSFNTKCRSGMTGKMSGRVSDEAMEQTGDMEFAEGGSVMQMNMKNTSKWIGATCPPGMLGGR